MTVAGCNNQNNNPSNTTSNELQNVNINVGCLNGPSGFSMAKMLTDNAHYNLSLAASPDIITTSLISGELDIAALPVNLAATLYNQTENKFKIIAVTGLGNIYLMSSKNVDDIKQLEGKTIVVAGKGATPEYAIMNILEKSGVNAELEFKPPAEVAAAAIAGQADFILIPEPFVTQIMNQSEDMKVVFDVNELWENYNDGKELLMTCVVARLDFIDANKVAVDKFLDNLKSSIEFCGQNHTETAELAVELGMMENAQIAKKAILNSAVTFISGNEMKEKAVNFLSLLYETEPKSIGDEVPDDGFYYNR